MRLLKHFLVFATTTFARSICIYRSIRYSRELGLLQISCACASLNHSISKDEDHSFNELNWNGKRIPIHKITTDIRVVWVIFENRRCIRDTHPLSNTYSRFSECTYHIRLTEFGYRKCAIAKASRNNNKNSCSYITQRFFHFCLLKMSLLGAFARWVDAAAPWEYHC